MKVQPGYFRGELYFIQTTQRAVLHRNLRQGRQLLDLYRGETGVVGSVEVGQEGPGDDDEFCELIVGDVEGDEVEGEASEGQLGDEVVVDCELLQVRGEVGEH